MYAVARSRFRISRSNRRFLSTALLQDQPPPPPPLPEPSSAAGAENKSWNFLKYSLVAVLTGGAATAGYATYGTFNFTVLILISLPFQYYFTWIY